MSTVIKKLVLSNLTPPYGLEFNTYLSKCVKQIEEILFVHLY